MFRRREQPPAVKPAEKTETPAPPDARKQGPCHHKQHQHAPRGRHGTACDQTDDGLNAYGQRQVDQTRHHGIQDDETDFSAVA